MKVGRRGKEKEPGDGERQSFQGLQKGLGILSVLCALLSEWEPEGKTLPTGGVSAN